MTYAIILAILILVLFGACAVLVAKLLRANGRLSLFEKMETDKQSTESQLEEVRKQLGSSEATVARLQERLTEQERTFQSERLRFDNDRQKSGQETSDLFAEIEKERQRNKDLSVEFATLQSERNSAQDQLKRYQQGEKERADLVRAEIENLSNKIFEEKTGKFKEIGTTAISNLVTPVRENLEKLQKSLIESETKDAVREQSLREALERVQKINSQLGLQADSLAKALRSDNKMVGDFGEEILERILEFSGLQNGIHFVEQGVDLSLKDESGHHLKPDVVIFLPENRCLVVDSKMSLKSWVDAQSDDETVRAVALVAFQKSVRLHVDELANKPYTESLNATGKLTVDFKFMFIPIEGAFHACLQMDRGFYQYAFEHKVILVSPATLLAVLTTVSHTWKQFEIGKNAEAIRARASILLNKLNDFCTVMLKVGEGIAKANDSYEMALKKLTSGTGNLIRQAQMLQELKVDSKPIPSALLSITSDGDEV